MVAGLTKRKVGGDATEVDELGRLMTSPCPLCKRSNWTAQILWVDTSTVGWQQLRERCFSPEAIKRRESPIVPISMGGDG
jgi:hypothetical protein